MTIHVRASGETNVYSVSLMPSASCALDLASTFDHRWFNNAQRTHESRERAKPLAIVDGQKAIGLYRPVCCSCRQPGVRCAMQVRPAPVKWAKIQEACPQSSCTSVPVQSRVTRLRAMRYQHIDSIVIGYFRVQLTPFALLIRSAYRLAPGIRWRIANP